MTVTVNDNEANMIRYALNEMGGRRCEQAIDRNQSYLRLEAEAHWKLANRFIIKEDKDKP